MNKRIIIYALTLVFVNAIAVGQNKLQWRSQLNFGIATGERGSFFNGTGVTGLKYKGWYSGIGSGIDMYRLKSVPLFLSVQKQFSTDPSGFYVYADGGANFPAGDVKRSDWIDSKFKPAFYTATGLGYRVGWKNRREVLLLNAGYSFKRLKEQQTQVNPCLFPPCPENVNNYKYDLNTWIMRFGLQF